MGATHEARGSQAGLGWGSRSVNRHTMRAICVASAGVALISSGFAGAGAAGAAAAGPAGRVTSFSSSGVLSGAAATSASNVWAVGDLGNGKTLIVH